MTPNPAPDSVLTQLATPIATEVVIRLAVSTRSLKPEKRPTVGSKYRDLNIDSTSRPDVELWGEYVCLDKFDNGPEGYHYFYFGKPKTQAEIATPYQIVTDSKHYEWPTILHAVAFATDSEFPVNEKRPGNRTVAVPRVRARPIVTESAFALCRTETRFFLDNKPFNIPTHPQPVAGRVDWVTNDGADSLVCLHTDMDLPARGESWNVTEIAGDIEVVGNPMPFRHFPATPFVDWQPFTMADNQRQTEAGLWERRTTIIYPPTFAETSSL